VIARSVWDIPLFQGNEDLTVRTGYYLTHLLIVNHQFLIFQNAANAESAPKG